MNRKRQYVLWLVLLVSSLVGTLLMSQDLAAQCPMCRTAVTQSAEGQRWARGINAGVTLLLGAPFLISGSIALLIFRIQVAASAARVRAWLGARLAVRE